MSGRLSAAVRARNEALPHAGHIAADAPGFAAGAAVDEAHAARVRMQIRAVSAEHIEEARFLAFGCPSVIACASWVAEHAVGRAVGAAAGRARGADVAAALEVEPDRIYAADLAVRALEAAVEDWKTRYPNAGVDVGRSGE